MPALRRREVAKVRRRKRRAPKREAYIGFVCDKRRRYEGRPCVVPRTCLSYQGGLLGYSEDSDYDPEEFRLRPILGQDRMG